ncbi:cyclase family protein [Propionibacterium freudenreichii]|uniref:Cyclase family protein n=2 Tax=Propionibacterium freudenreichii TaxID=1744 RepID=A0A0B7NUS8_PROFF|nr:cyclase family protein [Propionibacterium freudenreichii]AJQ91834.1 Cyclase family protein [Propionibacterium freudenreichii subsp. freudenreichii]MCT2975357.1 cyclase family protein [Propionibacterium freudenreichii]MCT3010755.1 cyclase family protein [Propionibacterium freudenreichii]MCT3014079.1 cyclase family protein [Propionibacterium freudenreichii]MCT3015171.1 cyclase family protein [Propionibacterium freudenreichii]
MNTSNAQELPRAVDLSMLIEPHWRFGPEFGEKELEKPHFTFHSTLLRMAAHAFSHCDAPFHVSPDMETIDEMGLDRFFGPARMVDVSGHGDRAALGEKELREGGAAALQPGEIALIRSDHELRHPTTTPQYWVDSPWITAGGARFLLDCGIKAVGFDFPQDRGIREDYDPDFVPSTDPVEDWACHSVLLTQGVVQIEYLCNLRNVHAENFDLFALPLKIKHSDGGPARVVAIESAGDRHEQ